MRIIATVCVLLLFAAPVEAAGRSLVLYIDGALFMHEIMAAKGITEISLPAAMQPGSLRIKPLDGCSIERVEIVPVKPDKAHARELASLIKRKDALTDRLQALNEREAVFEAAAKTQSGKSPRKTKTNPEPMAVVRQGTEFAFAQLESVYRNRRITESELKSVENRLVEMGRERNTSVARFRLSGKGGRVEISYIRPDLKWVPSYDFRLNKPGEANVVMRAQLPGVEKGTILKVVPVTLAEAADGETLPVPQENCPQIAVFTFPVEQEKFTSAPVSTISFSFKNISSRRLPAGEATCYRRGEFIGKTIFRGSLPGDASILAFGR